MITKKELKKDSRIHKWILLVLGIFLFLDGILSLVFGNYCLVNCANNSLIGNIVRWVRTLIGVYLVYLSKK